MMAALIAARANPIFLSFWKNVGVGEATLLIRFIRCWFYCYEYSFVPVECIPPSAWEQIPFPAPVKKHKEQHSLSVRVTPHWQDEWEYIRARAHSGSANDDQTLGSIFWPVYIFLPVCRKPLPVYSSRWVRCCTIFSINLSEAPKWSQIKYPDL
jgi:hypothetical protein